jgi:hypothetical protein
VLRGEHRRDGDHLVEAAAFVDGGAHARVLCCVRGKRTEKVCSFDKAKCANQSGVVCVSARYTSLRL